MDLRSEVDDADFVQQIMEDWEEAVLSPEDRALLEFTDKLSRDPRAMGQEDVDRLKAAGFDDRAVHDVTQVVSYFNYINRVAGALGTDPEPEFPTHGGRPQ